jgi:hypothetical protein
MKAGSFGNHRDADPKRLWAAMPTDAFGEADGNRRSPKIDRAHAGDLGAGGNAGPICFWGWHQRVWICSSNFFSKPGAKHAPQRRSSYAGSPPTKCNARS